MKLICTFLASLVFLEVAIVLSVAQGHSPMPGSPIENSEPGQHAVIVELFTSEGCSSCPPADALLKSLSEQQPVPGAKIIALEEHVDYWDRSGWKDPFSSAEFTERQNAYAHMYGKSGVYTPQMIVDGHMEFVGSRSSEAREIIEKAASQPKVAIQLIPSPSPANGNAAFDIKVSNLSNLLSGHEAELWIAITEKGLYTDVKAGENAGEQLHHAPVVRAFHKSSTFGGTKDYQTHANLKISPSWQRENLSFVAFAVDKNSRTIIGAASTTM
jgi:hypothetical protein